MLLYAIRLKLNKGIAWRHYYGPNGPRPPPVLHMWAADAIGDTHKIISTEGFWYVRKYVPDVFIFLCTVKRLELMSSIGHVCVFILFIYTKTKVMRCGAVS